MVGVQRGWRESCLRVAATLEWNPRPLLVYAHRQEALSIPQLMSSSGAAQFLPPETQSHGCGVLKVRPHMRLASLRRIPWEAA